MPDVKVNVRGAPEAQKFLADLRQGAQAFGGTSIAVGTRLPRGLFTDVGTSRGTRPTHWLSGLAGQASSLVRSAMVDKLKTPLQIPTALEAVGEKLAGMARGRAPRGATGKLRGNIEVVKARGLSRLGSR